MNNPVVKILSLFLMIVGMFVIALMGRATLHYFGIWQMQRPMDDLIAINICIFLGLTFLTLLFMWVGRRWSSAASSQTALQEEEAIRELTRIQNRIEERVTNLETILLGRAHDSVRHDKF